MLIILTGSIQQEVKGGLQIKCYTGDQWERDSYPRLKKI